MNWKKFLSIGIGLVMIAAVAALAIPSGMAAAQTPTPQPKTPLAATDRANNRLARLFQTAQKLVDRQEKNLERAGMFDDKISDRIGKLKAAGKNTSVLEAALTQFQNTVNEAQQKHADAASVLSARAGFDANGKVIDRPAARVTLQGVHTPLREARKLLAEGLKNLKNSVKEYRQANTPQTKP